MKKSQVRPSLAFLIVAAIAVPASTTSPAAKTQSSRPTEPRFLPLPEDLADPVEQQAFAVLVTKLAGKGPSDQDPALAAFDEALAKFGRPTEMRGLIQYSRAGLLLDNNENDRAIDAIEESIRLLPEFSGPLITGAYVYAYSNQPGRGADYMLRAIDLDPPSARQVDDYEVQNLIKRLNAVGDQMRIGLLSERLLAVGWVGQTLGARSNLAEGAIKRLVEKGDVERARQFIPYLLLPHDGFALLTMNAYQPIWGDIERWAGPRLEKQWAIYLREARARWQASKSLDEAIDYARALGAARHETTLFSDILPLFQDTDEVRESELLFLVPQLADALARSGRTDEGYKLYELAARLWPLGENANALNVHANHARFMLENGRAAPAVALFNKVVADARRWGPEVNIDGLAAMHHYRACALFESGRRSSAALSIAIASDVEKGATLALLHLCLDDFDSARQVMIKGLEDDGARSAVLGFMQPAEEWPNQPAYLGTMKLRADRLRADPALVKAIARHGRILPFRFADGAPPENSAGN